MLASVQTQASSPADSFSEVHYGTLSKTYTHLRIDADKTQQEIAELLNMHRSVYRRYESGERETPSWVIVKLAQYYRVSTDYLLGLKDEP